MFQNQQNDHNELEGISNNVSEISTAYLNGRELELTEEYGIDFVKSRIKRMFED